MAQISPKLFSKDLATEIFPSNVFYTKGQKDTAAGNVDSVDIPLAGAIGEAKIGRPALPVAITQREDSVKNYPLVQVYAEPKLIEREEDIVLNYNKQLDISRAMGQAISTKVADYAAQAWGASETGYVLSTSGTSRTATITGGTGNRKGIAKADLIKVRNAIMKMNIEQTGWLAVITPEMHNDLLAIADFVDFEKTGVQSKLAEGIIGRLLGIDFIVRWNGASGSAGLIYNVDGAKKALDAEPATNDRAAAMFFHPNYVRYAEAFPETIINRKPAGYLGGTIIEAVVRFGATQSRGDGRGVLSLVEAIG